MDMNVEEFVSEDLLAPTYQEFPEENMGIGMSSTDELNNPLGLTDKDVQLEYDNFPAKPTEDEASQDEPAPSESPGPETSKPLDSADDVEDATTPPVPDASAIFGSDHSDDEDEIPSTSAPRKPETERPANDDDDDNHSHAGSIKSEPGDRKLSDFDIMMEKKSEERRRAYKRKKRGDCDLINDHDDKIQALIVEMKAAAEKDRRAHQHGECAISKITMLPRVMNLLRKHDLQTAFLDCGILSALADWLAPLPDGNLTHIKIRESILKVLAEMSTVDSGQLKNSGIGKAVMLLYKHPKEMKENRAKAGKLIQEWSRPIFGTSANYRSMSREEREERDMEMMPKRRRHSLITTDSDNEDTGRTSSTPKKRHSDVNKSVNDEDPNKEIQRARVPQPSLKDYVIRPKHCFSAEASPPPEGRKSVNSRKASGGKSQNRFEKRIRGMKEQQRSSNKMNGHISLEGRKM